MLRNYLTVALRGLLKNTFTTLLSSLGLAVGISCAWLGVLYVWDQYEFDRFHENGDRIYRVIREITDMSGTRFDPGTHPIGPVIAERIPEVESVARSFRRDASVTHDGRGVVMPVCIADPELLEMFSFPVHGGNGADLLREPATALITSRLANSLFPSVDPIGKVVKVTDIMLNGEYRIVGLLREQPRRSTIRFDLVSATFQGSGRTLRDVWRQWPNRTRTYALHTYVLLHRGVEASTVEAKLQSLATTHNAIEDRPVTAYRLQPLSRIHVYSGVDYGWRGGTFGRCWAIALIGGLVLVNACFNTVNLATARASGRASEMGLRRIVGATRGQLARQSLVESMLLSILSTVVATAFVQMALPRFNALASSDMTVWDQGAGVLVPGVLGLVLLVGLLAGGYPALMMPRISLTKTLWGTLNVGSRRAWFRTTLVVAQFGISAMLLFVTVVVYQQMSYIRGKDLGFSHEQIIVMPLFRRNMHLTRRMEAVRSAFANTPGVVQATTMTSSPGTRNDVGGYTVVPEDRPDEEVRLLYKHVGDGFLDTFEIELLQGESLDGKPVRYQVGENAYMRPAMISASAARALGWSDPVGKRFHPSGNRTERVVVGVFDDIQDRSLFYPSAGLVLETGGGTWVAVRILSGNIESTVQALAVTWKSFLPNHPFEYQFLDEAIDRQYRQEMDLRDILSVFAGLSVFIACLGVMGLVSYTAQQRKREIGIRKTIGATARSVMGLLSRDFLKLALAASCITIPFSYHLVRSWLEGFAYRIAVNPLLFVGSTAVLLIALCVSVSCVGLRTARMNPVEALHLE